MCGKKLYLSLHVKYLGVYLDEYLNWATHVNQLCVKCDKPNVMLSKICYFVNETTLQSILLSSIPIYLMHVLLGDNPLFHLILKFALGYSRKKKQTGGRGGGSIKKEVELPGVFKKNSFGISISLDF